MKAVPLLLGFLVGALYELARRRLGRNDPCARCGGLICRLFHYRDIEREGRLYLRRYYLTPRTWRWRLFLHLILRPDPDPHQHDHPWPFFTLVLRRHYYEIRNGSGVLRMVRWFGWRPAAFKHRIMGVGMGGAWTLVLAGRAEREWGFWVGEKFVPWFQYLGVPNESAPEDRIR